MRLQAGRVAVVTGAASGIGLALAEALGARGMRLLLVDIDSGRLERAANGMRERGWQVHTAAGDVSDAGFIAALGPRAADLGPVQLVCSNAGTVVQGESWTLSADEWDRVIGVNLMAGVHLVRTFVPMLIAVGEPAHLLFTGSMASVTARAGIAPYVCSKHALLGLAETLASELAMSAPHLGVTILMPGLVDTAMSAAAPGAMSAAQVAEIAMAAVVEQRLFAFTHPDRLGEVERRFAAITETPDS